jgi:hypothetical protein
MAQANMWGSAQEGFRLTNPVGSFAGGQGPGAHQPALFENKPQTEAIRAQKIEAMALAASRTGGLEAYNAVREAHGLPRVRSAAEAHREQEEVTAAGPLAGEVEVAANEPTVAGVEIIEGHHTGWNAPAWIVRLPKGTGEFRALAALVKAHDGYYQKAGPRFPWGFYLRSRAAAHAFAAAATNTTAPQPAPVPVTSGPTQLRVIRTTHYIARAGMPATGGMISGQEGQLTEIEVTDGRSVGRAFVRENTWREGGGFYMSSNERWGEKTGARTRDPQILELAVESGPWSFDEVARLVARVDHKHRRVDRNARFTPKWAHREFNVEPGATILQQSALDTPETLRAAINVVNGPWRSPIATPTEPPPERRPSYTAKLRTVAGELRVRARGEEGRERRTNTHKRAGQAAHAIERAREDLRRADSLERIAGAVEAGEAPALSQIAGLTHLDALDREVGAALRRQAEAHDGKDRGPLDLAHVRFPPIRTTANVLRGTLREANATKKKAPYLMQLAERTDDDWIILDERDIGELRGVVRDAGTNNTLRLNLQHHDRLRAIGVTDTDTLRAAIGQYLACCRTDRKKASPLELALRELQNATYDGYFPTPRTVADRVVELAEIPEGAHVLEPSAGKGDLADAVRRAVPSATINVVEVIPQLREVLELKGYQLVGDDFLQFNGGPFSRIVMNPPFEHGKDATHVRHAYDLLEPGGVLVSIVSEGLFFRENAAAFRAWLAEVGGTSEKLPEGAFMASDRSTGVATRIVVIHKPTDCGCKHGGDSPAKEASMDSEKAWPSDPEAARLVAEAVRLGRPFPWDETPTGKLADLARRAWVEVIWRDPDPQHPALQFLMASNERQAHYTQDMPWYSRADPIIFSAPAAGFKVPKSTLREATERIEKVALREAKRTGQPVEQLTPPPHLVAHLKVLRGLEKRRAKLKPYVYGEHGAQGTSTPAPRKPKPSPAPDAPEAPPPSTPNNDNVAAARKKAEARQAAEEARTARNREQAREREKAVEAKAAERLAKQREKQVAAEAARRTKFTEGTPAVRAEVVDPLTGERIPADLPFGTATGEMVVTVPTREGRIAVPVQASDVDPRTRRGRLLAGRAAHYQEVAALMADEIHHERANTASVAGGERFEDVGQAVEQYMAHNGLYHHIDAVADVAPLEEWMSRVEVRVGRAKHASPLSKAPAGRRLADAWTAGPTGGARAALRYIFGQGKGRRWDAVPWRMVDELERLLRRAAEGEARRRGTTWDLTVGWRPSTLRRGDLPPEGEYGRLSDADRTQVTRQFHAATFAEAARRAREYLAQNKKCMDLPTQRLVKLRIATFEKWAKAPGLAPPRLCDPLPRYGAEVCEYPSITADLEQLQHVCQTGKYDPVVAHQFIQEVNWSPPADYQPDDNFAF